MIICRTPFRISFTGGGTDLKEYWGQHGGCVISTSINRYIYLSMHPYFMADNYFLKYSKNELVDTVDDIKHEIIRECFNRYGIKGVDFNSSADIPAGTGMGSSSAFTVGLIHLCRTYIEKMSVKEDLAREACEIEIDVLGAPIGKQDQYAAALGGLNYIRFDRDGSVVSEKVIMPPTAYRALQDNLLLFYLGGTRSANDILKNQKTNSTDKTTVNNLHELVELTKVLHKELSSANIDALGEILDSAWQLKKKLAVGISNERIDHFYDLAIKNGALGGKLLGAGGQGFLLFYSRKDHHAKIRSALKDLREFPFLFEKSGSSIIYYN
jgi:D-glycero-alpha-D-manno-heptose-7-phosphate kinase